MPRVAVLRLIAATALCLLAALLWWLWSSGQAAALGHWVVLQQRALQAPMASALTGLRGGDPAALGALLVASAAYGFVHAAGPGHGKAVIGAAALSSPAGAGRIAALAVAAALAQSLTAVLLVYGGFALFALSVRGTTTFAEQWLDPAAFTAVALIGGLLIWRGGRVLISYLNTQPARHAHAHAHHHGHHHHDGACPSCGGHHATPDDLARAMEGGWQGALALIAAIAIRPCTGAIFLLVIAWRFDLALAGLAAVIVMGLGTAAFTAGIGAAAVAARRAALFASSGSGQGAAIAAAVLQVGAGGFVVLASLAYLTTGSI
ncbi:MAG: hypothetical protein AAF416_09875 [Pseudomonadota bacterium]